MSSVDACTNEASRKSQSPFGSTVSTSAPAEKSRRRFNSMKWFHYESMSPISESPEISDLDSGFHTTVSEDLRSQLSDVVNICDQHSVENDRVTSGRTIITLTGWPSSTTDEFSQEQLNQTYRSQLSTTSFGNISITVKSVQGDQECQKEGIPTTSVRADCQDDRSSRAVSSNVSSATEQGNYRIEEPIEKNQNHPISTGNISSTLINRMSPVTIKVEHVSKDESSYETRRMFQLESFPKLGQNKSTNSTLTNCSNSLSDCNFLVKSAANNFGENIPQWMKMSAAVDTNYVPGGKMNRNSNGANAASIAQAKSSSTDRLHEIGREGGAFRPTTVLKTVKVQHKSAHFWEQISQQSEPAWLRELKLKRSLRENDQDQDELDNSSHSSGDQTLWSNVKLRPTGLKLFTTDDDNPTPMKLADVKQIRESLAQRRIKHLIDSPDDCRNETIANSTIFKEKGPEMNDKIETHFKHVRQEIAEKYQNIGHTLDNLSGHRDKQLDKGPDKDVAIFGCAEKSLSAIPKSVNEIVNFDAAVERKIVILETDRGPKPKGILKKRDTPVQIQKNGLLSTEPTVRVLSVTKKGVADEIKTGAAFNTTPQWTVRVKHGDPPPNFFSSDDDTCQEESSGSTTPDSDDDDDDRQLEQENDDASRQTNMFDYSKPTKTFIEETSGIHDLELTSKTHNEERPYADFESVSIKSRDLGYHSLERESGPPIVNQVRSTGSRAEVSVNKDRNCHNYLLMSAVVKSQEQLLDDDKTEFGNAILTETASMDMQVLDPAPRITDTQKGENVDHLDLEDGRISRNNDRREYKRSTQLTRGMSKEKAINLVRKYFENSLGKNNKKPTIKSTNISEENETRHLSLDNQCDVARSSDDMLSNCDQSFDELLQLCGSDSSDAGSDWDHSFVNYDDGRSLDSFTSASTYKNPVNRSLDELSIRRKTHSSCQSSVRKMSKIPLPMRCVSSGVLTSIFSPEKVTRKGFKEISSVRLLATSSPIDSIEYQCEINEAADSYRQTASALNTASKIPIRTPTSGGRQFNSTDLLNVDSSTMAKQKMHKRPKISNQYAYYIKRW